MTNSHNQPKETEKSGWKMPEPVFRVSDGYCPLKSDQSEENDSSSQAQSERGDRKTSNMNSAQGSEENLPDITLINMNPSDLKAPSAVKSLEPPIAAQKQSNASVQTISVSPVSETPSENKSKNKTVYIFFAVLGFLVMLILAASLLAIAYLWFFYRASGETQF